MQAKFSRPLKFKNLLIGKWFCVDSYGFLSMLAIERFWNELPGNVNIKAADSVQNLYTQLQTLLFIVEFI